MIRAPAAALAAALLLAAGSAAAEPLPLAEAIERAQAGVLVVALTAPLPGSPSRGGVAVICGPEPRVRLQFGGFPAGRPVQARLTAPDGATTAYGRPLVGGGPRYGFHIADITDPPGMRRFIETFFAPGSRLGDGNIEMVNRLDAPRNGELRNRLLACLAAR